MFALAFAAVMAVLIAGVHLYLWHRLVKTTTRPGRWRTGLTIALVVLAASTVAAIGGTGRVPQDVERVVAWPGYVWFALTAYLLLILLVLEIPRLVAVRIAGRRGRPAEAAPAGDAADSAPVDPVPAGTEPEPVPARHDPGLTRRLLIARTTAAVAGAGAAATVGFGLRSALGPPVVERVPVHLAKLDARMAGFKVAVVSDIHLGPLTGVAHTARIVGMINRLDADLVAIVGDLVDGDVATLGKYAEPLADLETRAYFVTGNHEYYTRNGPGEWIEELRGLGVRPLVNERVEIARGGAVFELAGVNDLGGERIGSPPDFAAALDGRDASRPVLLMAHQPVQVKQAAAYGVDLQLSGHTHGGQMWPFGYVVGLQQPVVAGLATVDGTQVYTTRGAGYWGPPVRVGAPPEITLVELLP